jgi:hypothetical protein
VVPVLPHERDIEDVRYYAAAHGERKWKKMSSKDLDAKGQGCNANQIMLYQPGLEDILEHTDLSADMLDTSATLYAGVARTLSVGTDSLPSICSFDGNGFMTIPVKPGTTRGVILVFTKQKPGTFPPQIFTLMATTDPEIKNGVGAGDGVGAPAQ